MDRPRLTDANTKIGRKSDDISKFDRSFKTFGVFPPTSMLNTSSDIPGCPRKIHLGTKSMTAKFDVGGQKMMKNEKFENDLE